MFPFFSENLDIGENYTRGELCDLMNIRYSEEIECGVFKLKYYSTIILFSTIKNNLKYVNGRFSDTNFLYSSNSYCLDSDIINHQSFRKELLLLVRIDESTGFYYFGRCKYSHKLELPRSRFPLYCLELLDTCFSNVKGIEILEVS